MFAILRFIILPAVIIWGTVWWLVLKHRLSRLLPFLILMAAWLLIFKMVGLSPMGFFVSVGGYLWLVVLAWIAAALVRAIFGVPA
jgi:hypothetical protein